MTESAYTTLKAVALFERDSNDDIVTWSFPNLEEDVEQVIKARNGLNSRLVESGFVWSRFKNQWQYMLRAPVTAEKSKVTGACLAVVSSTYNPEKYQALLEFFMKLYQTGYSPIPIMQAYLAIFTTGQVKTKLGGFVDSGYDDRRALISPVEKVFELLGVEAVVIWVAMVLKKRVFVYSENMEELLSIVRSFPLVGAWHRQDWDLLRPFCTLGDEELSELKASGVYVAGFTNPGCADKTDLYDLFVDLTNKEVKIADHAKGDFMLGKFHQQTGKEFVKVASESASQAVIKAIAVKTKELLTNIQALKTTHEDGSYVTLEELSAKKLPLNMDKFLYNVAKVEGLTKQ